MNDIQEAAVKRRAAETMARAYAIAQAKSEQASRRAQDAMDRLNPVLLKEKEDAEILAKQLATEEALARQAARLTEVERIRKQASDKAIAVAAEEAHKQRTTTEGQNTYVARPLQKQCWCGTDIPQVAAYHGTADGLVCIVDETDAVRRCKRAGLSKQVIDEALERKTIAKQNRLEAESAPKPTPQVRGWSPKIS
jgi:hypothetical protein